MSFSFYVPLPAPPAIDDLRALVSEPEWLCDDEPDTGVLEDGGVCHVYVPGDSARGVELAFDDGTLQARIMTCSSRADHELAIAIVRGCAREHDAAITAEGSDEPLALAAFADEYGPAWVTAQVAWGPGAVIAIVERETVASPITMSGARRPFIVGPRFLGELRERGPDSALGERLLAAFIHAQYIDLDDAYYAANILRVTQKDGGASYTIAAWAPGVSYLFPDVERFAILTDTGAVEVLHARGPELAGAAWKWLDEKQALVEQIPESAWTDLVRRARALSIA